LTAALPVADISLRMRITPHPSATPRFRRFRPQVERPRLRPSWRIALTAAVAAVSITLLYLGERAAIDALVGGEFAAPAGRTIARAEERALDALLARVDAERKEDEERARRIAAEHIDPQSCELDFHVDVPFCDESVYQDLAEERAARARADEEARSTAESLRSARLAHGPARATAPRARR
jgi:hypothetical protein